MYCSGQCITASLTNIASQEGLSNLQLASQLRCASPFRHRWSHFALATGSLEKQGPAWLNTTQCDTGQSLSLQSWAVIVDCPRPIYLSLWLPPVCIGSRQFQKWYTQLLLGGQHLGSHFSRLVNFSGRICAARALIFLHLRGHWFWLQYFGQKGTVHECMDWFLFLSFFSFTCCH